MNHRNHMLMNAWFVSIITLLVLSNSIPDAFTYALIMFYVPFVILACYVVSFFPYEIWLGLGLMCLFLWMKVEMVPYSV